MCLCVIVCAPFYSVCLFGVCDCVIEVVSPYNECLYIIKCLCVIVCVLCVSVLQSWCVECVLITLTFTCTDDDIWLKHTPGGRVWDSR